MSEDEQWVRQEHRRKRDKKMLSEGSRAGKLDPGEAEDSREEKKAAVKNRTGGAPAADAAADTSFSERSFGGVDDSTEKVTSPPQLLTSAWC